MSIITAPNVFLRFKTRSGESVVVRPHGPFDQTDLLAFIVDVKQDAAEEADPKWVGPFSTIDTFSVPITCSFIAETRPSFWARVVRGERRRIVGHCYLMNFMGVALHPRWRDQGIGPVLVNVLLDWARANPRIRNVRLQVKKDKTPEAAKARRFHERMGFVPDPEFHPDGPEMKVLYMRQRVKPEGYVLPSEVALELDDIQAAADKALGEEGVKGREDLARRFK